MKTSYVPLALIAAALFLGGGALVMMSGYDAPAATSETPTPLPVSEGSEEVINEEEVPVPTEVGDAPPQGFAKLAANALYVPEQQTTSTVTITHVNIVPKGYVVIYTSKDGAPGDVLGTAELARGTQAKNIEVKLSRAMNEGEELIAMLYEENGDGVFDPTTDTPVTDVSGNPLSMTFYAFADASDPRDVQVMF